MTFAYIENMVEDNHDQKSDVEGRNGSQWVKVSLVNDKHPGGENQNPGYTTQGDSH